VNLDHHFLAAEFASHFDHRGRRAIYTPTTGFDAVDLQARHPEQTHHATYVEGEAGPDFQPVLLATEDFLENRGNDNLPVACLIVEVALNGDLAAWAVVLPVPFNCMAKVVEPGRAFFDQGHVVFQGESFVFSELKVLFLHGLSSDGGRKTAYLRFLGYGVLTPRLSDWSFRRAVRSAQDAYDEFQPDVIVGSSRGGAVAMALARSDVPLVLLAPAWRWCGVEPLIQARTTIIHSPSDKLVSISDSRELCRRNATARLIEVGTNHRLNDEEASDVLADVLDELLPNPRGKCE